jgi:hypothetical protein
MSEAEASAIVCSAFVRWDSFLAQLSPLGDKGCILCQHYGK